MNTLDKSNEIVDACVQPTTTLTPAKEYSSKVNSSFSSSTEALTNDTPDNTLQEQTKLTLMTNHSRDTRPQRTNVPQIVTFESPMRRKRRCSFASTSDHGHPADCCNTDVDVDTDLSGEDVDSTTTDSYNSTIVSFTQEISKNSLHSRTQVSSSEFTITSPNLNEGSDHTLHPFHDIKQQTAPPLAAEQKTLSDFTKFRLQYLFVHTAIMLADGLQGKNELSMMIRTRLAIQIAH